MLSTLSNNTYPPHQPLQQARSSVGSGRAPSRRRASAPPHQNRGHSALRGPSPTPLDLIPKKPFIFPIHGTPEAVAPLFDKEIQGFGEIFRVISYEEIGTATMQSRCVAGVSKGTYIFCLPGSSGACATGWDKLIQSQLDSTI